MFQMELQNQKVLCREDYRCETRPVRFIELLLDLKVEAALLEREYYRNENLLTSMDCENVI